MSITHKQSKGTVKIKVYRNSLSAHVASRSTKLKSILTIDLRKTQYKIIKEVVEKGLGWKTITKKESIQQPDIIWTDSYVSEDDIYELMANQKINHFPGSFQLGNKHFLAKNINKIKKQFPQDYKFFPDTWLLPDDFQLFKNCCQKSKSETWILKPADSCQGRGILITNNIEAIEQKIKNYRRNYIVQQYIKNPYLLNNLKFDLRLYVLITSLRPLFRQQFNNSARFATSQYKNPQKGNISNTFIHLTNYAINKKNPLFNNQEEGHKRKFSSILEYLKSQNINTSQLMQKISKAIVNTIISAQPFLSHLYASTAPNRLSAKNCFQVLGFDILLDNKMQPYIMQVNHTPSFKASSEIDKQIKFNLIKDTLSLVSKNKSRKQENTNSCFQWSLDNNYEYKLIYPLESSKQYHNKLLQHAQLSFDLWTGVIKKTNISTTTSTEVQSRKFVKKKSFSFIDNKLILDTGIIQQIDKQKYTNSNRKSVGEIMQEPFFMIPRLSTHVKNKTSKYLNKQSLQIQMSKIGLLSVESLAQKKKSFAFISKLQKMRSNNSYNFTKNQDYSLMSVQEKKSPLKIITFKAPKNNQIRIMRRSNNISKRLKFA